MAHGFYDPKQLTERVELQGTVFVADYWDGKHDNKEAAFETAREDLAAAQRDASATYGWDFRWVNKECFFLEFDSSNPHHAAGYFRLVGYTAPHIVERIKADQGE